MVACRRCGQLNPVGASFCNACGVALERTREERRKAATLLFCDVAGSTELGDRIDAEAVRELMFAYFREVRTIIERYGGTVEKFVGDAVLGVFGVPVAHEDDALRAVRAADELGRRLPALNADLERRFGTTLALRIGINTGEVVAGDPSTRETFVSGDAVNVAARLEQAAPPGGVLIGEATLALAGAAVEVEAFPPLDVKGKGEPIHAFLLLGVRAEGHGAPTRHGTPLVGRVDELAALEALLEQVRGSGRPARALVLGEPGVGKTRLAESLLAGTSGELRILTARCLPYGEGITYSPLAQLLRQAAAIGESPDTSDTLRRLGELFGADANGATAAAIMGQVLGLADSVASPPEIVWAALRLAETLARERPLVLLVDDLQWAEDAFVDLLLDVVERARAPLLLLCLARPELVARRPSWRPDVRLEPLADDEARALMEQLVALQPLDEEARTRLLAAAGGNPLFLEELVAFLDESGDSRVELPPTLDALLTARLDALEPPQRRTLERGSVEGEVFHRGAVVALADDADGGMVDGALRELLEHALVRSAPSSFDDDSAFRFHHLLLRDAAYRGTAKRRRAELHLRFASWFEDKLGRRVGEAAEILAYHLEQAWLLRSALGPLDESTRAVGERAADLLASAARRSLARGDAAAAVTLLGRARALVAEPALRIGLDLERGVAAREAGAFELSEALLRGVLVEAADAGLEAASVRSELELALLEAHLRPHETTALLREVGARALAEFERLDDELGRALALSLLAHERWTALRCAEMEELLERALGHAERAGDDRLTASVLVALARAVLFGPRPAAEASRRCEGLLASARGIGPTCVASISMMLAVLEAAQGHAERARELGRSSIAVLEELAPGPRVAVACQYAGLAELILGEPARAEIVLRRAYDLLDALGERAIASTVAALLARALVDLGGYDEAERLSTLALEWGAPEDVATQAYARSARACALAALGAAEEARAQALEAVELSAASDFTNQRGDVFFDLAIVLGRSGDQAGASAAAASAHAFYVAKGNTVCAARAAALV